MTNPEWTQFICLAIAGAFGLVCLFDGTRRMAARQPGRGRAGRLAVGVIIVGLLAGYAYWQHRTYVSVATAARMQEKTRELPVDWGKKMSQAKREAASQALAQRVFVASGAVTPYFDAAGQRKVYVPTADDFKKREANVAAAARIDYRADNSLSEAILWLVLGLGAFVFGLLFAFDPAAKPAEAEAEAEPQA